MSPSLLLKIRNKHLGLVQGVISLVMYAGHSSKQVEIVTCHLLRVVCVCVCDLICIGFSQTQEDWSLPQSQ